MMTTIINSLRSFGFRTASESLDAFFRQATKAKYSPVRTCEELIEIEQREREVRNLATRTRLARLGNFKPLVEFDWQHPKKVDRALYQQLLTFDFAKKGHNVLFRGQSGVGKTTLAQNLGHEALQKGLSVRYCSLADALTDLLKQESLPALDRRLKRYLLPQILILDELGYLPCDGRSADLLYNIISRRHEKRSTVITTNLGFKKWGTVFPGAACVVALIDRFAQHCHIVDIDAESWRHKYAAQAAA